MRARLSSLRRIKAKQKGGRIRTGSARTASTLFAFLRVFTFALFAFKSHLTAKSAKRERAKKREESYDFLFPIE
jgi:hypothetical protein